MGELFIEGHEYGRSNMARINWEPIICIAGKPGLVTTIAQDVWVCFCSLFFFFFYCRATSNIKLDLPVDEFTKST